MNAYVNKNQSKRENICSTSIFLAKKKYMLNVHNSEGVQYDTPKLKITGIEAVRTSTPAIVRDKFKKAYKIMMESNEEQLQAFVSEFRAQFAELPPESVSFPRGVTELHKWTDDKTPFKKGVPIHVRGAILYNMLLKKYKLPDEPLNDGSKVKFCYLMSPNPVGSHVIAFPEFLPKEFGLHKYIDRDVQFEKTFMDPLKLVSDTIGWDLEHVTTLESFFG